MPRRKSSGLSCFRKSRDELNLIAKYLGISSFRKLPKEDLICRILLTSQKTKLAALMRPSWWSRYHNHVYGLASLLGVGLTILFFVWQRSPSHTNISTAPQQHSQDTGRSSSQEPVKRSEANLAESESRIASESRAFSSLSIRLFFPLV